MDYSSVDSELIESLDFLRPPVKRNFNYIHKGTSTNVFNSSNSCKTFNYFCDNISAGTQHPQIIVRGAESSTASTFNKAEETVKRYSVLSYTNLLYTKQTPRLSCTNSPISNDKPLIKITVTPKATQTANVIKKRNKLAKRVQTTVSNQESSIHTKNVYLVVPAGRKKDKERKEEVYQIKKTGSAKFASSYKNLKNEVIPIKQLSSLKLVLDSLNMDKKKDKNKKRRKKQPTDVESSEPPRDVGGSKQFCDCLCFHEGRRELSPDVSTRKSFVRITGQLGLSEDDRYVLRCAATVNDKPVIPDYTAMGNAPPLCPAREERRFFNTYQENSCPVRCYNNTPMYCFSEKKDFSTQTEFQNNTSETPVKKTNFILRETQATQVDFDIGLSDLEKIKNPYKKDLIQCGCSNIDTRASPPDSDSDANSVKGCQSPLVIISVYPAPDCSDNITLIDKNQNEKYYSARKTIICNQNAKQRNNTENFTNCDKRNDTRAVRPVSRVPSPSRNLNRNTNKTNVTEPKVLRSRRPSPEREPTTAMFSRPTKTITERNINRTAFIKEKFRDRSPHKNTLQIKETKGTNTDHNITKKMIVDNYTKKLTDYMDNNIQKKIRFPKINPSIVALDIDGKNEHYDVLFQQDNVTTDVKVKKTVKGLHNKNTDNVMDISRPMNKFNAVPEVSRRKSQVCRNEQLDDDPPLNNTFSRLRLRDSLEICHRHDTENNEKNRTFKIKDDTSKPFSAPIKHYRGDSCHIQDPIKRDKEIRHLLGVDKGVNASFTKDKNDEKKEYSNAVPIHYFYNKTCKKKIVTGINLMEVGQIPPCVCCDIRKNYSAIGSYHSRQMTPQPQHIAPEENIHVPSHTRKSLYHEPEKNEETSETQSPKEDHVSQLKSIKSKSHRKSISNNTTGTQYETQVRRTSLYQQLILNRNIQVFLQVEQFSKQRPIVLTRKQYDKVKRTIENTISHKTGREYKRKKCICRTSLISVGDVRRKPKYEQSNIERLSKNDRKDLGVVVKRSSSVSNKSVRIKERPCACDPKASKHTLVLFSHETKGESKGLVDIPPMPVAPRHAVSSIELRYASMSYMRHVTFSSTNVEVGSSAAPLQQKESHSIHTIFKGHKKCHTPNLGTSIYSLCSDEPKRAAPPTNQEQKKKPFLRRLMSCLVMRSTRVSELHNTSPSPMVPSVDSSIDSYHISTSLGAIEVTSSMYDTSASFYTNHSVYPINSKMKRGFFSSVREFLGNRKS